MEIISDALVEGEVMAKAKCDCGKIVFKGSIFCKDCMYAIIKQNQEKGMTYEPKIPRRHYKEEV